MNSQLLSSDSWKISKTFKKLQEKQTQYQYYQFMNATTEVLTLVSLGNKSFGTQCENLVIEQLGLGKRTSTQNDATLNGKKIEIKSARYWAGKDDCMWQHLEPDHDYEYVLFVLVDFTGLKVWGIQKSLLMGELREKKIVTPQGLQGFWTIKSNILPYLTPIESVVELQNFIQG
jgi:hypothetical protein